MHYPLKNPFFPTDLSVLQKTDDNSVKCIEKSINQIVWFGKDNEFE